MWTNCFVMESHKTMASRSTRAHTYHQCLWEKWSNRRESRRLNETKCCRCLSHWRRTETIFTHTCECLQNWFNQFFKYTTTHSLSSDMVDKCFTFKSALSLAGGATASLALMIGIMFSFISSISVCRRWLRLNSSSKSGAVSRIWKSSEEFYGE